MILRWYSMVIVIVTLALPACALPVTAQDKSRLDSVKVLMATQEYARATSLNTALLRSNPDNLEALYLSLIIRQTQILDYESYVIHARPFLVYVDSVYAVLAKRLPQLRGKDSTDGLFYLANANGARSIMRAKTGDWLGAVKNSLASIAMLKTVLKRDPSYDAACLGIGVFEYYSSTNLKWMPFFQDKTASGIKYIERATRAVFPNDLGAKNTLCWIYIEQGNYARADSLCKAVLRQYPQNTVFLRIASSSAFWTHRWQDASQYATRLIALSEKRVPVNWSDLMAGYDILAESSRQLYRDKEALAAVKRALKYKIPAQYRKIVYVQQHLEKIHAVKEFYVRKGMVVSK